MSAEPISFETPLVLAPLAGYTDSPMRRIARRYGASMVWTEMVSAEGAIRESEAANLLARNPHELTRSLECQSRITAGEMVMHASLARKASSQPLDFKRLDYPEMDPPAWDKFVTIRQADGQVVAGELPFDFWLQSPYVGSYQENYERHCGLE